jgi:hypothetical protein
MHRRMEFLLLAILGALMVLGAGYTQWLSIDPAKSIPITSYLRSWPWWTIVGLPFLTGAAYLVAAYLGFRARLAGASMLIFFGACEVVAVALLLTIGGVGVLATIFCALILAYVGIKYRSHKLE